MSASSIMGIDAETDEMYWRVQQTQQNKNGMIRKLLLTGTGVYLLALCSIAQDSSSQWRGPDRKGIYYETGLLESWTENGPELLWSFEGLGAGHSSPGIGNSRIFINGMPDTTGALYSFDIGGKNSCNQIKYMQIHRFTKMGLFISPVHLRVKAKVVYWL